MTDDFLQRLQFENAVWVTVHAHRGSVPRETDAWMAVFAKGSVGTVGGGHLEWQALQLARQHLPGVPGQRLRQRYPLGPTLGQCCGGEVVLQFETVGAVDAERLRAGFARMQAQWPRIALVGAGHVAQALVQVLGALPVQVEWFDSRDDIFVQQLPGNVRCEHSEPIEKAIAVLPPQSRVLIMSFSHAEDFEVLVACLLRQRQQKDLPFIGLIGSKSKWRNFYRRLIERGFTAVELNAVHCPVGLPGISGKEPAVIAVAVAAQLLLVQPFTPATQPENRRSF